MSCREILNRSEAATHMLSCVLHAGLESKSINAQRDSAADQMEAWQDRREMLE